MTIRTSVMIFLFALGFVLAIVAIVYLATSENEAEALSKAQALKVVRMMKGVVRITGVVPVVYADDDIMRNHILVTAESSEGESMPVNFAYPNDNAKNIKVGDLYTLTTIRKNNRWQVALDVRIKEGEK